jgi:peptidoglycan/LPS O-acetylase OafA/YrhL
VIVNRAFEAEKKWRSARAEKTGVVAASAAPGAPRIVGLAAAVGVFSYSLYLTHGLVIIESWRFGTQSLPVLINALLITTPACLAFAWIFFQFCEAPFMSKASASRKTSVAQAPAPNMTTKVPEVPQPIFVRSGVSLAKD